MGKNHNKDRMYITATEWREEWGGNKNRPATTHRFKKLPFNCCSLSLRPFDDPVCTLDGHVFDIANIIPYIKKQKKNPVTGFKLSAKELTPLHYHKNTDDQFVCPVLHKVFTEHSVIVAIRTSGHVYSKEAIVKLNLNTKDLHDLITGQAFERSDVITLQDPNRSIITVDKFDHMKDIKDAEGSQNLSKAVGMKRVFAEVAKHDEKVAAGLVKRPATSAAAPAVKLTPQQALEAKSSQAHYSTNQAAGAFTSTAFASSVGFSTVNERAQKTEHTLREEFYKTVKQKGYIALHTSLGDLNIELHADQTPMTCDNFVEHCKSGYYDNTTFHRSIPGFMIQGGDPTGTGRGGACIWAEHTGIIGGLPKKLWAAGFEDEIRGSLKHTSRGVLSMANKEVPGTNGSQFFLTYGPAAHLNGKHTVFGRVVGNLGVLDEMEGCRTDKEDRPKEPIVIKKITLFVDPFEAARKANAAARDAEVAAADKAKAAKADPDRDRKGDWYSNPTLAAAPKVLQKGTKGGVGKYMSAAAFNN